MADLVITAANVVAGSDSVRVDGIAGEAIAAGKSVYLNSSTKRLMLADSNSPTAEVRKALGISLNGAAAGQPLAVHKGGDLVIGAALTPGAPYYLSDTPGGICPLADVGTGEAVCQLGLAKSTTVLAVNIQSPDVVL